MTFTINNNKLLNLFEYSKAKFSYDDFIAIPVGDKVLIAFNYPFVSHSTDIITADGKYSFDGVNFESGVDLHYRAIYYTYITLTFSAFVNYFGLNSDDAKAHFNVVNTGDVTTSDIPGYRSRLRLPGHFTFMKVGYPWVVTSDVFESIKPTDDQLGRNTETEALFANNMKLDDSYLDNAISNGSLSVIMDYGAPAFYFVNRDAYVGIEGRYNSGDKWISVYPFYTFMIDYENNRTITFTGVEPYEPTV